MDSKASIHRAPKHGRDPLSWASLAASREGSARGVRIARAILLGASAVLVCAIVLWSVLFMTGILVRSPIAMIFDAMGLAEPTQWMRIVAACALGLIVFAAAFGFWAMSIVRSRAKRAGASLRLDDALGLRGRFAAGVAYASDGADGAFETLAQRAASDLCDTPDFKQRLIRATPIGRASSWIVPAVVVCGLLALLVSIPTRVVADPRLALEKATAEQTLQAVADDIARADSPVESQNEQDALTERDQQQSTLSTDRLLQTLDDIRDEVRAEKQSPAAARSQAAAAVKDHAQKLREQAAQEISTLDDARLDAARQADTLRERFQSAENTSQTTKPVDGVQSPSALEQIAESIANGDFDGATESLDTLGPETLSQADSDALDELASLLNERLEREPPSTDSPTESTEQTNTNTEDPDVPLEKPQTERTTEPASKNPSETDQRESPPSNDGSNDQSQPKEQSKEQPSSEPVSDGEGETKDTTQENPSDKDDGEKSANESQESTSEGDTNRENGENGDRQPNPSGEHETGPTETKSGETKSAETKPTEGKPGDNTEQQQSDKQSIESIESSKNSENQNDPSSPTQQNKPSEQGDSSQTKNAQPKPDTQAESKNVPEDDSPRPSENEAGEPNSDKESSHEQLEQPSPKPDPETDPNQNPDEGSKPEQREGEQSDPSTPQENIDETMPNTGEGTEAGDTQPPGSKLKDALNEWSKRRQRANDQKREADTLDERARELLDRSPNEFPNEQPQNGQPSDLQSDPNLPITNDNPHDNPHDSTDDTQSDTDSDNLRRADGGSVPATETPANRSQENSPKNWTYETETVKPGDKQSPKDSASQQELQLPANWKGLEHLPAAASAGPAQWAAASNVADRAIETGRVPVRHRDLIGRVFGRFAQRARSLGPGKPQTVPAQDIPAAGKTP